MVDRLNGIPEARNGQFVRYARDKLLESMRAHPQTRGFFEQNEEKILKAETAAEVFGICSTVASRSELISFGRRFAAWCNNGESDIVRHIKEALENSDFPIPEGY